MAQPYLGNELIEADPRNATATATHSEVLVDHHYLRARPAQVDSSFCQAVLQALALLVVQNLAGRGLTNVDRGLARKVGGCDLHVAHDRRSSCAYHRMSKRASTCSTSRCTSGG